MAAGCADTNGGAPPPPINATAELVEPNVNRADCARIQGTVYTSHVERVWYLANCLGGASTVSRLNCDAIRGTAYLSDSERAWYLANCGAEDSGVAEPRECHKSYEGACLATNLGDYDCADRGEDGPNFVKGKIRVVATDEFLLDRDGDGVGCE
jgi:hypothetical protein